MNFKWLKTLAILILLCFSAPTMTKAHNGTSEAYSELTVESNEVVYKLRIDLEELLQVTRPSANSSADILLPQEQLDRLVNESKSVMEQYILSHMIIYADGEPLEGEAADLRLTEVNDRAFAAAELRYTVHSTPQHIALDYNLFFDDVDPAHANYFQMTMDGKTQESVLTYEFRQIELGEMSVVRASKQFLLLGMEHLFTGYDHILFVVALLLAASSVRKILVTVTAFTAAHSLTLLLASLQIFSLPASLVEPVIALSIIYVALNNMLRGPSNHNAWQAFGFGLIHGFGFAGVLSEMKLHTGAFAASLLSFNIGIEIGQLIIVLLLFPLIQFARASRPAIRWSIPALSVVISLFGTFWLVERTLL
ncbi:HupE/UreJ family protein [Paenibacillus xerothermodurans]|nr:HupE/UreJ family protein [Paenibacillus xerothermodurans]